MRHTIAVWAVAALVLAVPGCKRTVLNQQQDVELAAGQEKDLEIDAIKKEQTVKVDFKSDGSPVSVYVYLEKDKDTAQRSMRTKKSDAVLGSAVDKEADVVTATVPADNVTIITIRNNSTKAAKVSVKMTN
jgi:hypothetical protein